MVVQPMDEQSAERREELAATKATAAEAAIAGALHPAVQLLVEKGEEVRARPASDHRRHARPGRAGTAQIRAEYNIPATPSANGTPTWMADDSEREAVKARLPKPPSGE
ncbi:hypothetical protein P4052_04215 [Pseudomonas aeruginosa]|nr:hypothetical protein [Pseudomonas aeruginosa]